MAEKNRFKLILYAVFIAVLLFGLIKIIALAGGKAFYIEFLGLLFLLVLTVIGFVGYAKNWGETIFFFVFLCYLFNLILVWYFMKSLYLTLLLLALVGMLVSFPKKSEKKEKKSRSAPSRPSFSNSSYPSQSSEPHSEVFDLPKTSILKTEVKPEPKAEPIEQKVERAAATSRSAVVTSKSVSSNPAAFYSPGKLVASKASNIYHEPKCDWAKKIVKHRRVWFNSKEEAWEKGYRAHSCIN